MFRLPLLFAAFAGVAAAQAADAPVRSHDEHSYAEPDKVVVRDLGLDLRIDFAQKQLRGTADLALEWKDPQHRELQLDTRDLAIDRVLGKSADHWTAREQAKRAAGG